MAVKTLQPKIEFTLQPKQEDLLNAVEDVSGAVNIGFGGPRGGGKSRGTRDVMLIRRLKYPSTTGWIVRRTFGELWDNHIKKYFQERPWLRDLYSSQNKSITLPNGSDIVFRYAEHEGDLEGDFGKEAMDIFVDQAERFSEEENNFLRTCRRQPGVPDGLCKMVSTINPGGIGHAYMKRVFMDRLFVDNEIPASFRFILASGWDNIEWAQQALKDDGLDHVAFYAMPEQERFTYFITRTQYGRDLNALPETMRIQQLLGRWDFFEGQVFPELSRVHDLDTYFDTSDEIQWNDFHRGMKIIGSLDHASTGITASGITGIDVDENHFALDEYYKANALISEHAAGVKTMRSGYNPPDYSVIDPSTEAKTLQNRDALFSVQDAYRREGLTFISAHRASIAVGIDRLKELLKIDPKHRNPFTQELGSPRMFISRSRCPNLWKEMTELQTIDGKFVGVDHRIDTERYVAMSRPGAAQRAALDLSKLPTSTQFVVKSHGKWSREFDKKIQSQTAGTYW